MSDVNFTSFAFKTANLTSIPRTMPIRQADRVSLADFTGYDPTGTNDQSQVFASAIAAATPSFNGVGSKAAGKIHVPRGSYKLTQPVECLPGLTPGTFNSCTISGEAPACTRIVGNFNGYLFDTGTTAFDEGGIKFENMRLINDNTTAFTSGAIRTGGRCPVVDNCWISGMVGANFKGAVAPRISNTAIHATIGSSIGVVFMGDGGVAENLEIGSVDVGIAMSGTGQCINGVHGEVLRRLVVAGFITEPSLGLGYSRGCAILGVSGEAAGITLHAEGPSNLFVSSLGAQQHQQTNINPDSGSSYPDRSLWSIKIDDGCAESITLFNCSGGTSDVIDPAGGVFSIGIPAIGFIRSGGVNMMNASIGQIPSNITNVWGLPGTAGGGSAVAGAANCARFKMGDFVPVWTYNDLAWGTLTGAAISGFDLAYSSHSRLTLEVGAVLKGGTILAGTKVTQIVDATHAKVDRTQTVSSTTATFFCNNPGDTYEIGDSVDPLWTGSVSNAGKPITTGGGSERVTISFKETVGYVLVG